MKIGIKKQVEVEAKTLKIHMKVCDEFSADLHDQDGLCIHEYEGYVPSIMPGDHYGDYVILDIDIDTGVITNWKKPREQDIIEFLGQDEE